MAERTGRWWAGLLVAVMLWLRPAGAEVPEAESPAAARTAKALFEVCELYAPGHFGNSYEVLGENEMRDVLAEAAFWGFNRYGDWFDMDDCKDPFAAGHTLRAGRCPVGRARRSTSARRRRWACRATWSSRRTTCTSTSACPDLLATKDARVFGQLICPSNAEGPGDHPRELREPVRRPGPSGRAS